MRERLAEVLAHHAFSHVNSDGWAACLCGHVCQDDDDDGSHALHQAEVVQRIADERAADVLDRTAAVVHAVHRDLGAKADLWAVANAIERVSAHLRAATSRDGDTQ